MSSYLANTMNRFCGTLPEGEQLVFMQEMYQELIKPNKLEKGEIPSQPKFDSLTPKKTLMLQAWQHFLTSCGYYRQFTDMPQHEIELLILKLDYGLATGKYLSDRQAQIIHDIESAQFDKNPPFYICEENKKVSGLS
jgi:hypothetical protein